MKFLSFFTSRKAPEETSSEFSRFFREASSREKKKVFMEVARKASADQRKVIENIRSMHVVN